MATSLSELLDGLAHTARESARSSSDQADAATAIGHLGRALGHLRRDGVSHEAGDRQEREVSALATACAELAQHAPVQEGPMARLAAAAADSLAVLHGHSTVSSRWAIAAAMTDVVTPLAGVPAPRSRSSVQLVEQVQRLALVVQHAAASRPPSSKDAALLERPLAAHVPAEGARPGVVVPEAVAMLLHATGPATQVPSVAEVLTYSLAAETVTALAQHLGTSDRPSHLAAPAWRAVREALRPYDDGSRQLQPHAPPAVVAAMRLQKGLTSASAVELLRVPAVRGVVAAAAQHMPTLASQMLYGTVKSWGTDGTLVAFARDLAPREERLASYLRGYRPGGLVRVHPPDLQPVISALHNARLLSLAVAVRAADSHPPGFPQRTHAANVAELRQPAADGALEAANREASRQVLLGRRNQQATSRSR